MQSHGVAYAGKADGSKNMFLLQKNLRQAVNSAKDALNGCNDMHL